MDLKILQSNVKQECTYLLNPHNWIKTIKNLFQLKFVQKHMNFHKNFQNYILRMYIFAKLTQLDKNNKFFN